MYDFPEVSGRYILDAHWSIDFLVPFYRKAQKDSVLFWNNQLQMQMWQWQNIEKKTPAQWIAQLPIDKKNIIDYKTFEIGYLHHAQYFTTESINYYFHYWVATTENLLYIKTSARTEALIQFAKQICQTIEQPIIEVFKH